MLFPDRIPGWHKYMGEPKDYPCCSGRGWRYEHGENCDPEAWGACCLPDEMYCACECGQLLSANETGTDLTPST